MNWYRFKHTLRMCFIPSATKRASYLKKHNILYQIGNDCMVMFRKIPLYPKLISFGNNVWIASQVSFLTHDMIHKMLNNLFNTRQFSENVGCIEIKDNVFIGSNTTILPNVTIGPDTIIGAGTLVTKDIGKGVYAGVPARYICSLKEFMDKRNNSNNIIIDKNRSRELTMEAVNKCWRRHKEERNGI